MRTKNKPKVAQIKDFIHSINRDCRAASSLNQWLLCSLNPDLNWSLAYTMHMHVNHKLYSYFGITKEESWLSSESIA